MFSSDASQTPAGQSKPPEASTRRQTACDNCRLIKQKCEVVSSGGTCSRCNAAAIECQYTAPKKRIQVSERRAYDPSKPKTKRAKRGDGRAKDPSQDLSPHAVQSAPHPLPNSSSSGQESLSTQVASEQHGSEHSELSLQDFVASNGATINVIAFNDRVLDLGNSSGSSQPTLDLLSAADNVDGEESTGLTFAQTVLLSVGVPNRQDVGGTGDVPMKESVYRYDRETNEEYSDASLSAQNYFRINSEGWKE